MLTRMKPERDRTELTNERMQLVVLRLTARQVRMNLRSNQVRMQVSEGSAAVPVTVLKYGYERSGREAV